MSCEFKGLTPHEAFPEEVIQLHDEQGIPWPNWYIGSIYRKQTPELIKKALDMLEEARQNAKEDEQNKDDNALAEF
jgi:hypothetical protein